MGLVVVIDVFRCFTTEAVAFENGAKEIVLVAEIEEAFDLQKQGRGDLLMGEVGGKKPPDLKTVDLKTRTKAAANTAKKLEDEGLDLEPTAEDKDVAAKLSTSYAENPEETKEVIIEK